MDRSGLGTLLGLVLIAGALSGCQTPGEGRYQMHTAARSDGYMYTYRIDTQTGDLHRVSALKAQRVVFED